MGYFSIERNIKQLVEILYKTTTGWEVWEVIDSTFINATITSSVCTEDKLGVGDCYLDSCTFTFFGNDGNYTPGMRFRIYSVLTDAEELITNQFEVSEDALMQVEKELLGTFEISDIKFDGVRYTIQGYKGSAKLNEDMTNVPLPMRSGDMIQWIVNQCGLEEHSSNAWIDFTITALPEGNTTYKAMLGYIAGVSCANVRFDSMNRLIKSWFWDSPIIMNIPRSMQYESRMVETMSDTTISGVVCGNAILGSAPFLYINSPYVTEQRLTEIYNDVRLNHSYTIMDVKYRGFPGIDVGTRVNVETQTALYKPILVMEQTWHLDGGMNAEIRSVGKSGSGYNVTLSPVENKIKKATQQSLSEMMGFIFGDKAGYFNFIDETGSVILKGDTNKTIAGWQITDSPTITNSTRGWRYILGGLYHSGDGFGTIDTFALNENGEINASAIKTGTLDASIVNVKNLDADNITTGTLSADKIQGGTLKMGGANNIDGKIEVANAKEKVVTTIDKEGIATTSLNATDHIDVEGDLTSKISIPFSWNDGIEDIIGSFSFDNTGFHATMPSGSIGYNMSLNEWGLELRRESSGESIFISPREIMKTYVDDGENDNYTILRNNQIYLGYATPSGETLQTTISPNGIHLSDFGDKKFITINSNGGDLAINTNLSVTGNGEFTGDVTASNIGNIKQVNVTGTVSATSGSVTNVASINGLVNGGVYLIFCTARFASNNVGYRQYALASSSTSINGVNRLAQVVIAGSYGYTISPFIVPYTATGNETLYLNVRHTAGTALDVGNISIWAVRIK